MPIYEYQCQGCGKQFEIFQSIVDSPVRECPSCHQDKLERLISQASFILKGGGWYRDGYGSKAPETKSNSGGETSGNEKNSGSSGVSGTNSSGSHKT